MSIINDKLKNNDRSFVKTDNTSGNLTLEDLRKFVKECDELELPAETPLRINIADNDCIEDIIEIQGDDIDIIFYNW